MDTFTFLKLMKYNNTNPFTEVKSTVPKSLNQLTSKYSPVPIREMYESVSLEHPYVLDTKMLGS